MSSAIAEQVIVETNAAKLMNLIEQLCSALDNRKKAAVPSTGQTRH
jgi:hypothetical protein